MAHRILCVATLLAFGLSAVARADELADKGRAVLEKSKASVVTIRIVVKQQISMPQFGSHEEEIKSEATGTVIDPSGLTVLSLNATDPTAMLEDMMSAGGREGFEMKSTISDLKILQDDGAEISAQIVLRDRDLDLAFLRPVEAPKEPLPALDLAQAVAPAMLDPIITLNRLGRVASREYAVSIERINAVVTRPRTFYVMGNDPSQTNLGSPALNVDGLPIGICVLRTVRGGDSGGSMGMFGGQENMLAIIVPAADVLEVAKQAPQVGEEAKEIGAPPAEEKKDEEAPSDEPKPDEPAAEEKPAEESPDGTIKLKAEDPAA
ncbi:MAG: hypothetical protein SGI88_22465 [Candidatus Hydrogenedentes bacterium]|nr:hypothetical protein [Candidatus Hydrogenedentota bacterium]